MKHCYILLLLLVTVTVNAQRSFNIPTEAVRLHTDKDSYAIGDTVWIEAVLTDGETNTVSTSPDYPDGRSNFVYIELHDTEADTLVSRYMIKKDSAGVFFNRFQLPLHLSSGCYTLVGYTRYMMNFSTDFFAYRNIYVHGVSEHKEVDLHAIKPPLSVVAAPEGGVLLRDHMQCVAFAVKDADGKGVDAEAYVTDSDSDSIITRGNTATDGMGRLYFMPELNVHYKVTARAANGIKTEKDLPEVKDRGATLRVHRRKNLLFIEPLLNGYTKDDVELVVSSYGKSEVVPTDGKDYVMLNTLQLPKGLFFIQIIDKKTKAVMADRTVSLR